MPSKQRLSNISKLEGHVGRVWNCSWNPEGTILATCGEDKSIRIWTEETGDNNTTRDWTCKLVLTEGHERTVRQVAWSPCGRYLASASFDGTLVIWHKENGTFSSIATLEGHEKEAKSVAWSPSGSFLASCSRDKSVWLWHVDVDEEDFMCASVVQRHTQDVKKVLWHPHQDILVSSSYDNTINLYKPDDDDWICYSTLSSHASTVWSVDFDAPGSRMVSVSDDKTLKMWKEYKAGNKEGIAVADGDSSTWKCVCTVDGDHKRSIYDVSWSSATGIIATACGDNGIRLYEADDHENEPTLTMITARYSAHDQDVNSVKWNPKIAGLLASTSDDGLVKLWKFDDDEK